MGGDGTVWPEVLERYLTIRVTAQSTKSIISHPGGPGIRELPEVRRRHIVVHRIEIPMIGHIQRIKTEPHVMGLAMLEPRNGILNSR